MRRGEAYRRAGIVVGESHDRDAEGRTTAERKRLSGIRPRSRWPLSSSSRAFSGRCQGSSRLVSRHWPFGPADLSLSDMLVRVRTPRHAPAPSEHLTGLVTMVPLREPTFAGDLFGTSEDRYIRRAEVPQDGQRADFAPAESRPPRRATSQNSRRGHNRRRVEHPYSLAVTDGSTDLLRFQVWNSVHTLVYDNGSSEALSTGSLSVK